METKQPMDARCKTAKYFTRTAVAFLLSGLLLNGCQLPRIAVLSDPLTPEEHLDLGTAYERNGNFESAREQYRLALEEDHPRARIYLGNTFLQEGNIEEAERWYQESIRIHPEEPLAYNNLAWLYHSENRNPEDALRLASRAVELDETNSDFTDTLTAVSAGHPPHQESSSSGN